MSIHLTGISHKTAALLLREKLAFTSDDLPTALHSLANVGARGAVIVSTCNRSEIIWRGESPNIAADWLADYHHIDATEISAALYNRSGAAAVSHLFRMASGLDSMVLGEPQVLGQVKQAVAVARDSGTLDPILGRLFQHAFTTAKRVRSETEIGSGAVSIAYAAVKLAQRIFADFSRHSALLIGAGETIELVARHLRELGVTDIVILNRSLDRAELLAEQVGGRADDLSKLSEHLSSADIVVSSTGSRLPLIRADDVKSALSTRRHKPMFLVDLAVPRDIEESVAKLRDVFVYSVDDLRELVDEGLQARQAAAARGETIVADETERFEEWLKSLQAVDVIRSLRDQAEIFRDASLSKAHRMLASGAPAEEALHALANELTNKLLHTPTSRLRDAGAKDESELLGAASELFNLNDKRES